MRTPRIGGHGVPGIIVAAACALLASCTSREQPDANVAGAATGSTQRALQPDAEDRLRSSRAVVAEILPYAEVDEKLVYGYFVIPADMIAPLPAVILIHDRWGLNEHMREISEQLAAEGYIVLGVDLFAGATADTPAKARELEIDVIEAPEMATENLKQAYDFILHTAGAPRIATMGFGFGGAWSLNSAIELPEGLSASVNYYGQVNDDQEKLGPMTAPILGLFAKADRVVPPEAVGKFESALESLEKDYEIHVFPNARRGFADRLSDNYDAEVTADAWNRVLEFLQPRMLAEAE